MNIREQIEQAKKHLDTDPHLANYILRDLQEIKDAKLSDLSWAMHRDVAVSKNDVLMLIELLEDYLRRHRMKCPECGRLYEKRIVDEAGEHCPHCKTTLIHPRSGGSINR